MSKLITTAGFGGGGSGRVIIVANVDPLDVWSAAVRCIWERNRQSQQPGNPKLVRVHVVPSFVQSAGFVIWPASILAPVALAQVGGVFLVVDLFRADALQPEGHADGDGVAPLPLSVARMEVVFRIAAIAFLQEQQRVRTHDVTWLQPHAGAEARLDVVLASERLGRLDAVGLESDARGPLWQLPGDISIKHRANKLGDG